MFTQAEQTTEQNIDQISNRVQQIENEEPQYKGFNFYAPHSIFEAKLLVTKEGFCLCC